MTSTASIPATPVASVSPIAVSAARTADLALKHSANARTIADLKLDLVWIAPGSFLMGSPVDEMGRSSDETQRTVLFDHEIWFGRTPVTQAQWVAVMGSNPSHFKGDELPVETVSWDDAMAFCHMLTGRERAAGRLPNGYVYTLPTEAQWEYACRAGTTGPYAGNLDAMAWYVMNSNGTTHPVGMKLPNPWGFFDMEGNVMEWCLDWYIDHLQPDGVVTTQNGPEAGTVRVIRGGCWSSNAASCRSASRNLVQPGFRLSALGFRVALVPNL